MSLENFSRTQAERFQRHFALAGFGIEAQSKLLESRVLVVGAGGLGAPILTYLAAAGVGTIDVVDHDVVDRSNLHRQVIHSEATLGRPKTESAAERMRGLHPEVTVHEHREQITGQNALQLIEPADLVIDGSDNFATRYVVSDACEIAGKPLVSGSILRFFGQVSMFVSRLPDGSRGPTYRDLYPEAPDAGEVPTCAEAGVLGVLPGVIGSIMATEAVKFLAGIGEPLIGRVISYDALTSNFREFALNPDPDREPVTSIGTDVQGLGGAPETTACDVPAVVDPSALHRDEAAEPAADPDGPAKTATENPQPAESPRVSESPQAPQSAQPAEETPAPEPQQEGAGHTHHDDDGGPAGDIDFNPFTGDPKQADDLTPAELRRALTQGRIAGVVDVREPHEWESGGIEGAAQVPMMELWRSGELPGLEDAGPEKPVVLYCAHGIRSRQAMGLLKQRDPEAPVVSLLGGYELFRQS